MTRQEEASIIAAVLAGDRDHFEALVLEHQRGVYRYALRMLGNEQDALDAAQETFLRAYRSLSGFRGESRFSVWLYRMAGNVCLDMLRKRPPVPAVPLEDDEGVPLPLPDTRAGPQAALERAELRRAVRRAILDLPPEFRQALVLREINGLSYDEIAHVTGLEPGTVRSRIFRARKKLAALLTDGGNFSAEDSSVSTAANTAGKRGGKL